MIVSDAASLLSTDSGDSALASSASVSNAPELPSCRMAVAHCHPSAQEKHDRRAEYTLALVSVLTAVFIVAEFTGGALANSLAIMTDAGHMLSDLLSFLISLFAICISRRPATKRLSFGFYRAEILGAVCSIFIIWTLTGILVYLAVLRVIHQSFSIHSDIMMYTAAGAVVFNIIMGVALHLGGGGGGGAHGHSHFGGHSHSNSAAVPDEAESGRRAANDDGSWSPVDRRRSITAYPTEVVVRTNRQRNINMRAAFVHVIGDLLQSVGVLAAAVLVKFKPDFKLADPICTFVFSILVLITTATVMRDILLVLMEGTPRDVDYNQVRADLEQISGVATAHSLHMWSLTMDKAALAVHLAIERDADSVFVMQQANGMMRQKYNITFTTVQVEPYDESVMTVCKQCVGPER